MVQRAPGPELGGEGKGHVEGPMGDVQLGDFEEGDEAEWIM